MKKLSNKLVLGQLDNKLKAVTAFSELSLPSEGWMYNIRQAFGDIIKAIRKKNEPHSCWS